MNISGIRGNHGFYSGQLHMGKAEEVSQDLATQAAEAIGESPVQGTANQFTASESDARSKQSFTSFDFAQQYDPNKTYEMVGKDSDLRTLDVEKAISAMQKDSVLQQYQFFVGSQGASSASNGLRPVENFDL